MTTKTEAESIALRYLNSPRSDWPDMPEMVVTATTERPTSWVVYWTSRPWHEHNDVRYALAGNGPVVVSKITKMFLSVGSLNIEEQIQQAEQRLHTTPAA